MKNEAKEKDTQRRGLSQLKRIVRCIKMADEPNIELINDKWQNILPQYESNRFDLAIVDPPYGIGKFTCDARTTSNGERVKNNKKYTDDYNWNESVPPDNYFKELIRVSKNRIIWGANYYNCFENGNAAIVWYKGDMTETISHCEIASRSFGKKVDYCHINWQSGFYRQKQEGEQVHPCQKPVALYRWLISKYANPGDTILDTHLGSGSSAIAAWQKKHDFVGIECDTDYFNDMLHRFNMNTNREYALESWQKQSEQNGQQTIFSQ